MTSLRAFALSTVLVAGAGVWGAWSARTLAWSPRFFCASGYGVLDAKVARSFVLQYLVAQNRFEQSPWVPLDELRAWRTAEFRPVDVMWHYDDGVSWDYTVVTRFGARSFGIWVGPDCDYSLHVGILEAAERVSP